jgi:hypothetical protein
VIAQIAALIISIGKLSPLITRLFDAIEEQRRQARRAELHDKIDAAIADAQDRPRVCGFADCPVGRGLPDKRP